MRRYIELNRFNQLGSDKNRKIERGALNDFDCATFRIIFLGRGCSVRALCFYFWRVSLLRDYSYSFDIVKLCIKQIKSN